MTTTEQPLNKVEIQRASNGKLIGGVTGKGFVPGKSGNPNGKPRGVTFSAEVKAWLRQRDEADSAKDAASARTRLDVILRKLADEKPEVLLHYAYGKPVETHEHTGVGGDPIELSDGGRPLADVSTERLRQLASTLFLAAELRSANAEAQEAAVVLKNGNGHV